MYAMATSNHVLLFGFAILLSATLTEQKMIQFSYTGSTGPEHWGTLSPAAHACKHGKHQSPINIVNKDLIFNPKLPNLGEENDVANGSLINTGVSVGVKYDFYAGDVIMDGKNFTLKQMHWHTPSEHTLDGQRFAAELHLVHTTPQGFFAVISVLYKDGAADPMINQMKTQLELLAKPNSASEHETKFRVFNLDTKGLTAGSQKYLRYHGSLTVPPCSENVLWTILAKPREISKEQIALLKAPLDSTCKDNSRPSQALNGRKVELYDETRKHSKVHFASSMIVAKRFH